MSYSVEFTDTAAKQVRKLDKPIQRRVLKELEDVASLDDPRSRGKGLSANWGGYWRYRVGDYRVICTIDDGRLRIMAVRVGHRSTVYQRYGRTF